MTRWAACALVLVARAAACPRDAHEWRVRSVRPVTSATRELAGRPFDAAAMEQARRSFEGGGAFSISAVYFERCEGGDLDIVFRSFRLRLPPLLPRIASLGYLAENLSVESSRARRVWAGYAAPRHAVWLGVRGGPLETRVRVEPRAASVRMLLAGPAVWSRPLLPAALRGSPDFLAQLDGALRSAESALRVERYARDPAFAEAARLLPASAPDCGAPSLPRRIASAKAQTGARQYGLIEAILETEACPALDSLRAAFGRIDRAAAARRAAQEIGELRALLDRLLHRTPLLSLRPVAVWESALVAPRRTAIHGAGAGARVSLLNWFEVTAGYLHRRGPFVEIRLRDPLEDD